MANHALPDIHLLQKDTTFWGWVTSVTYSFILSYLSKGRKHLLTANPNSLTELIVGVSQLSFFTTQHGAIEQGLLQGSKAGVVQPITYIQLAAAFSVQAKLYNITASTTVWALWKP